MIVRRLVLAGGAAAQCPDCEHGKVLQDAGGVLVECLACDAAFVLADFDPEAAPSS